MEQAASDLSRKKLWIGISITRTKENRMKLYKTIEFDIYELGGRAMEDVIFLVDFAISEDNRIFCTNAKPHEDAIAYLTHIGGAGAPDHWQRQVLAHFKNEDNAAEALGEAMTPEEFTEFEDALMGDK